MEKHYNCYFSVFLIAIILFIATSCGNKKVESIIVADSAVIQNYLDNKLVKPEFGGKVFSAHKVFHTDAGTICIWAYMQEYYKKDDKLESGAGWSVPLLLYVDMTSGKLRILGHIAPGDGDNYTTDVKRLFPKSIQKEIFDFPTSDKARKLEGEALERAQKM
ncbi:MAG: hypothetical protein WCM76_09855 [Bacteroidota bacterium]